MPQGSSAWPQWVPAAAALLLFGAAGGSRLAAQTADQRRALDAFRDSLVSVTDSLLLRREEGMLMEAARRARRDPVLHLRLGHLNLRQGDLGGASHYDDAASEFKFASELAPQFPYAWYGLGQAEFALGSRLGGNPDSRPVLAHDALSRATQAFARAVSLEPGLAPRLEEMARRALRLRLQDRADAIREALRRAALEARGPRAARLLLALGRLQREMGDSGALASFESYLASGENRALGLIEVGRNRLLRGDLGGEALYLEGSASDDPVVAAECRADLATLASDHELADFDLRRGAARADMLRRFWTMRDRLELRAEGERLAEHLRRLTVARREFLLVDDDGVERLDDRGRIFLRHGEPDDRASFTIPGVEPNESWRYRRGGKDMVLHFTARQQPGDFRLIESVLDVADVRGSLAGAGAVPGSPNARVSGEQLLRSRASIAPLYQQPPGGRADQLADYLVHERSLGRHGILVGTRSDSYTLRYRLDLNAWGGFVVAGGSAAQPAIQVLFAIPGYAVEPASGTVGVVYPVRVRFVALDSTGTVVATADSVIRIEPGDRIAANRSLVGHLAVPVLPGRLLVHAAVEYGEFGGTALGVDSVTVPSPGSGELALSDLLIGTRRGRLLLPLGDASTMAISPGGIVRQSDGMDLGVEVFGLGPGAEATLKLFLASTDEGDDSGAVLRWNPFPVGWAESRILRGTGDGPIVRWRVNLPLKKLKAGSWKLAVVVSDASGRLARRETPFTVELP